VTQRRQLSETKVAAKRSDKPMRVAAAPYRAKGFVWDYVAVPSSGTDYTFGSGTYFINGSTYFSGTLTFQPNCVIKLGNNGYLLTYGSIVCNGTTNSWSILTSKNDDLFGEKISGSTGNPTYAGNPALWLYYLSSGATVRGMKIRWAHTAVQFDPTYDSGAHTFQNSRLEQCQTGLYESCCASVFIYNSTKCGVTTPTSGDNFTGSLTDFCNGDTDSDGLPDSWETTYFGSITSQNGTGDPDGDGLTNYQEYLAGTHPNLKVWITSPKSNSNIP
jgi:hypothetical protein